MRRILASIASRFQRFVASSLDAPTPVIRARRVGILAAATLVLSICYLVAWSYVASVNMDVVNARRIGKGVSQQLAEKTMLTLSAAEQVLGMATALADGPERAKLSAPDLLGFNTPGVSVSFVDSKGTVLESTKLPRGSNQAAAGFMHHAEHISSSVLLGHAEVLVAGQEPVVPFLMEVSSTQGRPGGLLVHAVPARNLTQSQVLPGYPSTVFAVVEASGDVLSHTVGLSTQFDGELSPQEFKALTAPPKSPTETVASSTFGSDDLIAVTTPVGDTGLVAIVGISRADATAETRKLFYIIIPVVTLICLGVLATTALVLGQHRRLHQSLVDKEAAQEGLQHQATHDALTGLMNRTALHSRLDAVLAGGGAHALLFMDLDQFKVVNDTCGHVAGDELLKQVAYLLQQCLRKGDTLARMGGDEFAVLLESCDGTDAAGIAEKLREAIAQFRFSWQDKSFQIGVSIGVVPVTANGASRAELMRKADTACYIAKDGGRNRVHFYYDGDVAMLERQGELDWASKLQVALARGELTLLGQRIKSLQGADEADYFEVLVRMVNPDGSMVPPMAFLPAAERYGLMPALDRAVIAQAFRLHQLVQARSTRPIRFAINLSGQSLSDPALLEFIERALREHSINARSICFEVTETVAIANLQVAVTLMKQLKALGCSLALDDFGSGMSSFSYLKQLPVDIVKIDGSFVRNMLHNPVDQAMVQAISTVSQRMGLRTLAEYVETEELANALREMGVDLVQGYGVGKPESLEAQYGIAKVPLALPA